MVIMTYNDQFFHIMCDLFANFRIFMQQTEKESLSSKSNTIKVVRGCMMQVWKWGFKLV